MTLLAKLSSSKKIRFLVANSVALALTACGGGNSELELNRAVNERPKIESSRLLTVETQTLTTTPFNQSLIAEFTPTTAQLFDWAESVFPQYFSSQEETLRFENFWYRFYPEANIYLAVNDSLEIWLLGQDLTGGNLTKVGVVDDFKEQIYMWLKPAPQRFQKVDAGGKFLDKNSLEPWDCVYDHDERVFWESKANDFGPNDYRWVYTMYFEEKNQTTKCDEIAECSALGYVNFVNQNSLCGFTDWRLPTLTELESILDESDGAKFPPYIDTDYFPNTMPTGYWTGTSWNWRGLWWVSFGNPLGDEGLTPYRDIQKPVRLVRP